jgi:hypothetical protein
MTEREIEVLRRSLAEADEGRAVPAREAIAQLGSVPRRDKKYGQEMKDGDDRTNEQSPPS